MNQDCIGMAIQMVMPATVATGRLVSLCTIQAPSGNFGPSGAPDGLYNDVAGLVAIPCTAPPPSSARVQATEVKALAEITAAELHHVLLDTWYPQLDAGWRGEGSPAGAWAALIGANDGSGNLIDGYLYDILGVESDSQSQMTRMTVRLSTI
jgi:hypothetical protein